MFDWSGTFWLPRNGYYDSRPGTLKDILGVVIHNTGGSEDILADNLYHMRQAVWVPGDPTVHAPHIAYTYWIPRDPAGFFGLHDFSGPVPEVLAIKCNKLNERSWHANLANDYYVGIALQGNGEKDSFSPQQVIALNYLIDTELPSLGVNVRELWGHGELDKIYGGGEALGNNTICPGVYGIQLVKSLRSAHDL